MTPTLKIGIGCTAAIVLIGGALVAWKYGGRGDANAAKPLDEKSSVADKDKKPTLPANTNSSRNAAQKPGDKKSTGPMHNTNGNVNANTSRTNVATPNRGNANTASTPPLGSVTNPKTSPKPPISEFPKRDGSVSPTNSNGGEPARSAETSPPPSPPPAGETKPDVKPSTDTSGPLVPESGGATLPPSPFAADRPSNGNANSNSAANTNSNSSARTTTPGSSTPPASPPRDPAAKSTTPGTAEKYTIKSGDTLSKVAREHYGADKYWTKIRDANPGVNAAKLTVGQTIMLPPKESVVSAEAPKAAGTASVKKPSGETGSPAARMGMEEKPKLLTPTRPTGKPAASLDKQPSSTTTAKPTDKPVAPTSGDAAVKKPASGDGSTYVVAPGDTLNTISQKLLKSGKRWREIYNANKDKIKDPDRLTVGTTLTIPTGKGSSTTKPATKETAKAAH